MNFEDFTTESQSRLVDFWKSNGMTPNDFFCRECGTFMLDVDDVKKANYFPDGKTWQMKFWGYVESEKNRWLVKGRQLSGKIFFRRICWDCFFKHLFKSENISKRALKSSWYRDLNNGILRPPAPWSSPSDYFKFLFDITDNELEVEHKKFDTASLESFIRRHGPEKGPVEYEKYRERQAYTCSREYMEKEHGMSEEQWKAFNASRAVTKENLISKHGRKVGSMMWKNYCERQAYAGCKLEYFIEKFGEERGREEYESVNKKKVLSYSNFVRKYGEVLGREKWLNWVRIAERAYSKISQKLFCDIDKHDLYSKENSKYASKNDGELSIETFFNSERKVYRPDFVLGHKIIEFYGDYFHANPTRYGDDDMIRDKSAKEIRAANKLREAALESAGYTIKVVWESDYRQNQKKILKECLEFLHQ